MVNCVILVTTTYLHCSFMVAILIIRIRNPRTNNIIDAIPVTFVLVRISRDLLSNSGLFFRTSKIKMQSKLCQSALLLEKYVIYVDNRKHPHFRS